jgi:hypothetical protein
MVRQAHEDDAPALAQLISLEAPTARESNARRRAPAVVHL